MTSRKLSGVYVMVIVIWLSGKISATDLLHSRTMMFLGF